MKENVNFRLRENVDVKLETIQSARLTFKFTPTLYVVMCMLKVHTMLSIGGILICFFKL